MANTKILYVEDEPFLGKIVKESLESRGYEVHMETDGQMVMTAFEKVKPDICVLDVMLPNVDGFTLGKMIKEKFPEVPIIFLTAKTQTEDVLEGFKSGGNDYLKKPFSLEELIIRINNLLHLTNNNFKINSQDKDHYDIGKYQFDPLKYELRKEKDARKLSHRETELLKIMVRNPNIAISRKEILLQIWGDDSFFNSRNLDVYITKLRGYLKEDENVQIITLKGVGYRFVVE